MADYRPDSLYRNTNIIGNKSLDILNADDIDIENTATTSVKLELKHDQKPDLLAYELYGNAKLWWVFALFNQNKLKDPIIDFKEGITIKVPVRFS
tara:strand:+ start:1916 stop:2200 length:285 start_codon:yes stop_codon:yes gene_type:complete